MKTKNLLLAMTVLTALTLSGCSENEVTDINPDAKPAMTFDVYTGVQTKGKETTTTTIQAEGKGFGVLAYKTTNDWSTNKGSAKPEFMYNVKVSYSGSAWSYSPTKFWPTNDDKISFFAYAPYESAPTAGTDKKIILSGANAEGAPTITFEVNTTDLTQMVDLVTDNSNTDKQYTGAGQNGENQKITFTLKHVLTKVLLNAKTSVDLSSNTDTKVFITGVKVVPGSEKLSSKAKYKFEDNKWAYGEANGGAYVSTDGIDLYKEENKGVLNLAAITAGDNNWVYADSKPVIEITAGGNDATALNIFNADEYLYFIPVRDDQTSDQGLETDGDVKLEVSYDIVTKSAASVEGSPTYVVSSSTKQAKLPKGSLQKGNFYTYTIVIGMNDIQLDATVSEWTTDNNSSDLDSWEDKPGE